MAKKVELAVLTGRPTISVILPNYNHGRFVTRAINAVLAQESVPDEIIIIDDASTDDSLKIINALASTSSLVRVLTNNKNMGVPYSLARGLQTSIGKYVYFAAADDFVLPGFFSIALSMLEHYPQAGLVCGEARLITGDTGKMLGVRPIVRPSYRPKYLPPAAVIELLKKSDNWILTGSSIFNRERVLAAGGFLPELDSFADGYLARKLAVMHGFCFVPRPMANWYIFECGISRRTALDPARGQKVLTNALAQIEKDSSFPKWYGDLFRRRWRFGIARLAIVARPINHALLLQTAACGGIDRALLATLLKFCPTTALRTILLAWVWFRFTPMSLSAVLASFLLRHLFARRP